MKKLLLRVKSTEKNRVITWKVELFYLVGPFKMPNPGNSISVALRKLLQVGGRGSQAIYISFQQREQAVWTSKIKYQIKESSMLCMGRCKPPDSLNSFLSHVPQLSGVPWIIKRAREYLRNIYFCFTDSAKAFDCVDHNKLWETLQEMGIPDHLTWPLRHM